MCTVKWSDVLNEWCIEWILLILKYENIYNKSIFINIKFNITFKFIKKNMKILHLFDIYKFNNLLEKLKFFMFNFRIKISRI